MNIFDLNTSDAKDALVQAGFRDVERALHNLEELAQRLRANFLIIFFRR